VTGNPGRGDAVPHLCQCLFGLRRDVRLVQLLNDGYLVPAIADALSASPPRKAEQTPHHTAIRASQAPDPASLFAEAGGSSIKGDARCRTQPATLRNYVARNYAHASQPRSRRRQLLAAGQSQGGAGKVKRASACACQHASARFSRSRHTPSSRAEWGACVSARLLGVCVSHR
jgi:hypothetical protein